MTALEERIDRVAVEATEARALAGESYRKLSEMMDVQRGHTAVLNALRETQIAHGNRLDVLEYRFDSLERKVDQGFGMMATGMAQIVALIKNEEQSAP